MSLRMFEMWAVVGAMAAAAAAPAMAQSPTGEKVTGAELEAWFAADQMALAGINLTNNCHWFTKGPPQARHQTIYCAHMAPFAVVGVARIQGDQLCSKFIYPDGSMYEGCQDFVRTGDNRYEGRIDGVARNVFYRLIR